MAANSAPDRKRRPIRNFIIMPDAQWPYIIRLLAMVNLAGVMMASSICALFYFHFLGTPDGGDASGFPDPASIGTMFEGKLMDVVIPAFVIGDLVSLAIGMWLSLYFSRKIFVPIYRVTKWAEAINEGDLSARLKFRPGDDLQKLEGACNGVSDTYLRIIEDLRRRITEANLPLPASLDGISAPKPRPLPESPRVSPETSGAA